MLSEFNFFQHWYPLSPVEDLDPKRPTAADRLVIEFCKWFDKYCHGQLPWGEVGLTPLEKERFSDDRQFLLDRYRQHTQHCSSCRGALS